MIKLLFAFAWAAQSDTQVLHVLLSSDCSLRGEVMLLCSCRFHRVLDKHQAVNKLISKLLVQFKKVNQRDGSGLTGVKLLRRSVSSVCSHFSPPRCPSFSMVEDERRSRDCSVWIAPSADCAYAFALLWKRRREGVNETADERLSSRVCGWSGGKESAASAAAAAAGGSELLKAAGAAWVKSQYAATKKLHGERKTSVPSRRAQGLPRDLAACLYKAALSHQESVVGRPSRPINFQ